MDPHLFSKHLQQLKERKNSLSQILDHIKSHTGILLTEEEIQLSQKKIRLMVSSAKKSALTQKNISEVLKEIGYTVSL